MKLTGSLLMKVATFTLLPGAVLFAQDVPFIAVSGGPQGPGVVTRDVGLAGQETFRSTFTLVGTEAMTDGGVVTGAPYSADAVTETSRALADGNQISTTSTSQFYRDSAGRTRREITLAMIGPLASAGDPPKMILINDPVAKVSYTLDPATHQAHKVPAMSPMVRSKMMMMGKLGPGGDSGQQVIGAAGVAMAGVAGPVSIQAFKAQAADLAPTSESLGTSVIEGVTAEGTRTTRTIPQGKIGNAQPITIVNETWYAPDLQTTVMTKTTNPLESNVTFRLTNIQRVDQPASLFEVPADYTVVSPPLPPPPPPPPGSDGSGIVYKYQSR
jgi:hypothetical protein